MMAVSPNSTGEPSPKGRSKLKTECDAQLTELRCEEHHEEQVGTKYTLSLYPLFLKP